MTRSRCTPNKGERSSSLRRKRAVAVASRSSTDACASPIVARVQARWRRAERMGVLERRQSKLCLLLRERCPLRRSFLPGWRGSRTRRGAHAACGERVPAEAPGASLFVAARVIRARRYTARSSSAGGVASAEPSLRDHHWRMQAHPAGRDRETASGCTAPIRVERGSALRGSHSEGTEGTDDSRWCRRQQLLRRCNTPQGSDSFCRGREPPCVSATRSRPRGLGEACRRRTCRVRASDTLFCALEPRCALCCAIGAFISTERLKSIVNTTLIYNSMRIEPKSSWVGFKKTYVGSFDISSNLSATETPKNEISYDIS